MSEPDWDIVVGWWLNNIPYVWKKLGNEDIVRENLEGWRQYERRYIFPSDTDIPSLDQEMKMANCDMGVVRYFQNVNENIVYSKIRVNGFPVKVEDGTTNIYKYLYIEPPQHTMRLKDCISNVRQPIKRKPSWSGMIPLFKEEPYGEGVFSVSRGSVHFIYGDTDESFLKKMNEICRLLSYMYPSISETVEKDINGYKIIMEPKIWMDVIILEHFPDLDDRRVPFYDHNVWYKKKGKNTFYLCGYFTQQQRYFLFLYPEIKHVEKTGCYYFSSEYLPLVQNIFPRINLVKVQPEREIRNVSHWKR